MRVERREISASRIRRRIATIRDRMNEQPPVAERAFVLLLRRKVDQRQQMRKIAVHLPIAHEPKEVKIAAATLDMREGAEERRMRIELTVTNRVGDAHELLIDNSTSADVLMTNLRIAHHGAVWTNGKTDILTARRDQSLRKFAGKTRMSRCCRAQHCIGCIAFAVRTLTPTITHDEHAGSVRKSRRERHRRRRSHVRSLTHFARRARRAVAGVRSGRACL